MKRRYVRWFVSCDEEGNQVIAGLLAEVAAVELEGARSSVLCADGIRRALWEVPRQYVGAMVEHEKKKRYGIRLFKQEGHGPVRKVAFMGKRKRVKRASRKEKKCHAGDFRFSVVNRPIE